MTLNATSALRVQLLANGYKILPNRGKIPALTGWNTPEYVAKELTDGPKGTAAKRVASWAKRFPDAPSTGLLVVDGLVVLDLDIDDNDMIEGLLEKIEAIAPEIYIGAPTRFGSGCKIALFCRLDIMDAPFVRIASRRYSGHCVEVFGGLVRKGKATRQFGIYGPHSFNEDGSVAVTYEWHEEMPDLTDLPIGELPVIRLAQIYAIIGAFEQLAIEAGLELEVQPEAEQGEAVYDITDETRFDTDRAGSGLTYDELSAALDAHGELRCSSSFMAERKGTDTSRCWVFHSPRHDCTAVFVYGDEQAHYPQDYAQADKPDDDEPIVFGPDVGPPTALDWRERYKSGLPRPSLHNARLAIAGLGLVCSRDTFHNRMWVGRSDAAPPGEPLLPFVGEVTDIGVNMLRVCLSDVYATDFGEKNVRDAVVTLCEENCFDPVVDMLAEAQANWDGKPRLDRMAVDYFNAENTPLNRQMVRKTMLAAVARARQPGIKFDTILTMESPEGYNKSSAWALLAGEGNFSDASILGHNGREVQEQLAEIWIHENPELAGMRKAEAETIKAFASRQVDRARPAYGRLLVSQPRHSIEVATTNSDSYLQSPTGNRRFWPLAVTKPIDLRKLRRDRLQLWGEAATLQAAGEAITLDEALWAAAAVEQDARRVAHPWEAQLAKMIVVPVSPEGVLGGKQGYMVLARESGELRVHTKDILNEVLKIPNSNMHRGHSMALGEAMKLLGWSHRHNVCIEGRYAAGYFKPDGTGV